MKYIDYCYSQFSFGSSIEEMTEEEVWDFYEDLGDDGVDEAGFICGLVPVDDWNKVVDEARHCTTGADLVDIAYEDVHDGIPRSSGVRLRVICALAERYPETIS